MIRRGKHKAGSAAGGEQSWRELAGRRKQNVRSPLARRRRLLRLFKAVILLLSAVAFVGGIGWGLRALMQRETSVSIKAPSRPLERILFHTDGVLPNNWLSRIIDVRPGMPIMEVDIHQVKEALETEGQVESASVERVFPGDLRISVRERVPALRMAIVDTEGQRALRIVSRDGHIYAGIGYPNATVRNLLFVQPYVAPDGKMFPMQGIERVAELLDIARLSHTSIYRNWQVVSLQHYSGDLSLPGQIIEIRSALVPRIIFSATRDFEQQMERLRYILEYVEARGNPSMERIDLSLQGSAAVQFTGGRVSNF